MYYLYDIVGVDVLLFSFIVSFVLVLLLGIFMASRIKGEEDNNGNVVFPKFNLQNKMGIASWSAKTGWLSNLTTIGILSSLISSTALFPEKFDKSIDKAEFLALQVFFALLLVAGSLMYNAFLGVEKVPVLDSEGNITDYEVEYFGSLLNFLIASVISLWAVFGEIISIHLLLGEVLSLGSNVLLVYTVILEITTLISVIYAVRTVFQKAKYESGEPPSSDHGVPPYINLWIAPGFEDRFDSSRKRPKSTWTNL